MAVTSSYGNGSPLEEDSRVDWCEGGLIPGRREAELAFPATAGGEELPTVIHEEAVVVTAGGVEHPPTSGNALRHFNLLGAGRTHAEAAPAAGAPAKELTLTSPREDVAVARSDANHLWRREAKRQSIRLRLISPSRRLAGARKYEMSSALTPSMLLKIGRCGEGSRRATFFIPWGDAGALLTFTDSDQSPVPIMMLELY